MKHVSLLIAVALFVSSASGQVVSAPAGASKPPATAHADREAKPAADAPVRGPAAPDAQPKAERDIGKILSWRVPEVCFDHTPLEKVMEWVQKQTGVLVYVRYAILEEHGITRETPITVKAKDATLKQILWVIMNEAAGASGATLAYEASGDLILLSTHQDLGSKMVSRVYDFKDIHVDVLYFEGITDLEGKVFRTRVRRAVPHSRSLGGELFGPPADDAAPVLEVESEEEQVQEFMEFLLNTIEPETWAINGMGGKGTIFPYKGRLIIRNSLHVHQILSGEENP